MATVCLWTSTFPQLNVFDLKKSIEMKVIRYTPPFPRPSIPPTVKNAKNCDRLKPVIGSAGASPSHLLYSVVSGPVTGSAGASLSRLICSVRSGDEVSRPQVQSLFAKEPLEIP
jgi:hypothetical protein